MSIMSASGIWTYLGQARSDRVGISTFDMHLQELKRLVFGCYYENNGGSIKPRACFEHGYYYRCTYWTDNLKM